MIGVDYSLVIPDESLTLEGGAIKPWNTKTNEECLKDMKRYAKRDGIRLNVPYRDLTEKEKKWVIEGEPGWSGKWTRQWYGVKHFFEWLESKAYKMHVRVLLSRYRNYQECPDCHGARLKPEALLWRVGSAEAVHKATDGFEFKRHKPSICAYSDEVLNALPGLNLYDLMRLPLSRLLSFFEILEKEPMDEAGKMVVEEILTRLRYLVDVGVGYLTLERQSRTLSGGEVQRVNLTTALGTSLVNTLFVLDEPSIGLHPRDMDRINRVMQKLKNSGNTLVVVEHDPQVMLAADTLFDMGPGPGEKGGEIIFKGTPAEILKADTLTARYLSGKEKVSSQKSQRKFTKKTPAIELNGAREHNLKSISVRFPIGALSVVTGVSGSGKSTLIENILVPALYKAKGMPTESPGYFESLKGADLVENIHYVDQSPIGKTTRSNPASYVGAFDAIRNLFAQTDAAKAREYKAGTFSFNSGDGRCPVCSGNGFEHIEMQFLSDVYLRCSACNGSRYRPEILEITIERDGRSLNIAQVLDLSVSEACEYFKNDSAVVSKLEPLRKVGLDYIKLGQPVPTLSGGEAQRLKIAGFLAQKNSQASKNDLFIFDEPTTGLHFDDIDKLMQSLQELIDRGNTAIVIEHNLDVINCADWVIDLGPEGGDAGGEVVIQGTLEDLIKTERSYTGQALKTYRKTLAGGGITRYFTKEAQSRSDEKAVVAAANDVIAIKGAKEHNLKNISVDIPHDRFTVVTGASGSGKSTLAFDIVFKEGQRRYLESLNAYARSIVQPASKPNVDSITGIAPTVAIEQRTSRGGRKSTVATMTELYHFMRLIFVKLGHQYCPDCNVEVEPKSFPAIVSTVMSRYKGQSVHVMAPLVSKRKGIYTDLAKWANKKGYPQLYVDGKFVSTEKFPKLARYKDHTIELPVARIDVRVDDEKTLKRVLQEAITIGKGVVTVLDEGNSETIFSTHRACPICGRSFPELDPRLFSYNSSMGWCPTCFGTGLLIEGFDETATGEERVWADAQSEPCPTCHGERLNEVARAVRFAGLNIAQMAHMTVTEASAFFKKLKLTGREADIAEDALKEIRLRLQFLEKVGLGYLTLDRSSPSLSGGEAQRIRLASQLGSNLQGVCYILDEPTIGLHPRDNRLLLDSLKALVKKGNTLLVVEHDEETIREADYVIDVGPGAGVRGGEIIATGSVKDIMKNKRSLTGRYLLKPIEHTFIPKRAVDSDTQWLSIEKPRLNNLKANEIRIPLGRLTVLTGVSGSGKSSFARGVLLPVLSETLSEKKPCKGALCEAIHGFENVDRVLEVDQTPIGKTPRSCPATYIGFLDAIRRVFAGTNEAQARGYGISRFSFNMKGGRCELCEGQGVRTIEMNFLPDVKIPCEACGGLRYNTQTLEVLWKGKSIGQILAMDVDEAVDFFSTQPSIAHALKLMQDVGLGYLSLGQPSPTLSGGEAQRIKLVTELIKARDDIKRRGYRVPRTLYVLDEPTVGLHMADVEKLIAVLHRLVDAGNTVVVIEHNLDIMAQADWIIDMGPEGGVNGGDVVASGAPSEVMKTTSHTAQALAAFKREHDKIKNRSK